MTTLANQISTNADQWASVSGLDHAVSNLSEYVQIITTFFRGGGWVFRGEGELFDCPAAPSAFRNSSTLTKNRYPNRAITDQEMEQVQACVNEHPNTSDRFLRAFIPTIHQHDVNWLPLARHFGYSTRLLDVTLNPLIAAYFATDNTNGEDSYVYAMQVGGFRPVSDKNPTQTGKQDYPNVPISYLDLYDVDVEWWGPELDQQPYLFEATIPQERLLAQAGKFLFWRDIELNLPNVTQMIPIRINGSAKQSIQNELTAFGVVSATLFPSDDT